MSHPEFSYPRLIFRVLVFLPFAQSFNVHNPLSFKGSSRSKYGSPLFMREIDRQAEYIKRNYTWPLDEFVPNTAGWRFVMERRMDQMQHVKALDQRYNGWVSVMNSALVAPNFTLNGFALTQAPPELVMELKASLHAGLAENRTRMEHTIDIVLNGDSTSDDKDLTVPPWFIDQPELNAKTLEVLKPLHEAFAGGIELVGARAYGLRLYRNQSTLLMHTDKPDTHIIASILHIDSDSEDQWPVVLEDFHGNTHEVIMESGDMLMYESSKIYHGRPRTFHGSWYSSIFCHYYPVAWDTQNQHWEPHYAIPPFWFEDAPTNDTKWEKLSITGTGIQEKEAVDGWSALSGAMQWKGPFTQGVFTTP